MRWPRLILDFALTLVFNHLVSSTYYSSSLPTSLFFSIVTLQVGGAVLTIIVAEQLCVKRGMSEELSVLPVHPEDELVEDMEMGRTTNHTFTCSGCCQTLTSLADYPSYNCSISLSLSLFTSSPLKNDAWISDDTWWSPVMSITQCWNSSKSLARRSYQASIQVSNRVDSYMPCGAMAYTRKYSCKHSCTLWSVGGWNKGDFCLVFYSYIRPKIALVIT